MLMAIAMDGDFAMFGVCLHVFSRVGDRLP